MADSGKKILIVEDESIVAADIRRRLERLGCVVTGTAASAEEALEKINANSPDLVLMDITIKGSIDGIAASKTVRERFKIPVVFLTAHSDEATLQRAKITEPYGYIIKPFQERDLHIAIEMALYKHHSEMERARLTAELQEALARVKTLSGLLPICSSCKKIRDDKGYWERVEFYITRHSDATFTHGYCPDCYRSIREASGLPPKDYPTQPTDLSSK
jgi:CheY-like chemotaxis protein